MKEAASVEMGGSVEEKEPVEKRPLSAGKLQTQFHLCLKFTLLEQRTKNAVCSSTGGRQARKSTRAAS